VKKLASLGFAKRSGLSRPFSYHYTIQQQVLCIKMINFQQVMSILPSPPKKNCKLDPSRLLQHRLFQHLLDENDRHYGDLVLNTEVHWWSRDKVMFRIQELLP
jgi:hypothetical protein